MFALFFNLYLAMFRGSWNAFDSLTISNTMKEIGNSLGTLLTSMFNETTQPYNSLGNVLFGTNSILAINIPNVFILVSFVLALITSIGIVVMAVKGIKRVFGVFFMGIR